MPLIRSDPLPITRDDLDALRGRLAQPYAFEIVARDDQRFLFLRSPRSEPDPVADLEDCLERVPDWAVRDLNDVFLLGDVGSFHLPASAVRFVLERRERLDATLLRHWRSHLDAHYGLGLDRVAGDAQNLVRLGLRLPRARVAELDESDLVRIARAAGPLLDSQEAATVRLVYLLAEDDHVRLDAADFFEDVRPRWAELQRPPPPPPAPEPVVEAPAPPPAAAPRRRPTRVLNVRPALEIETQIDASSNPEQDLARLVDAEASIRNQLEAHSFDVRVSVAHDGTHYAFAAERAVGFPRRVLVKTIPRLGRDDADHLVREARDLGTDLTVVVALDVDDEARRRTVATKVKVISPDEVSTLSL